MVVYKNKQFQFLIGNLQTECWGIEYGVIIGFQFLIGNLQTGITRAGGWGRAKVSIPHR